MMQSALAGAAGGAALALVLFLLVGLADWFATKAR